MTGAPSDTDALAEIIVRTIRSRGRLVDVTAEEAIRDAMSVIAERAEAHSQHIRASAVRRADEHAREEERDACAKLADRLAAADDGGERDAWDAGWRDAASEIAAAIRARGETP